MNPIKTFGNSVIEGAKALTPSLIGRGIKKVGRDVKSQFNSTFNKKKDVAQKMAKPIEPIKTDSNRGFQAYKDNIDEGLKY